ncbi:MAG: hypothetical protein Ct9H90mP16_03250 [Candidatus Poseidoniales archaeon]|nr:MAG: hypothetical protein Ct9H90mP16_03250 [Candidatus Poseidoniales archaeon]
MGPNYEFFGAPVELFIFTHKSLGKYSASDAGLFMQNLILSAHSKGLGTCPQGAVAIWEDAVRKEFEISKNYSLLCGICPGYPSDEKINSFPCKSSNPSEIIFPEKAEFFSEPHIWVFLDTVGLKRRSRPRRAGGLNAAGQVRHRSCRADDLHIPSVAWVLKKKS